MVDGLERVQNLVIMNINRNVTALECMDKFEYLSRWANLQLKNLQLSGLEKLTEITCGMFYALALERLDLSGAENLTGIGGSFIGASYLLSRLDLSGMHNFKLLSGESLSRFQQEDAHRERVLITPKETITIQTCERMSVLLRELQKRD